MRARSRRTRRGWRSCGCASKEYGYDIDPGEVARIWRAGCIIRATLLDDIRDAFRREPSLVEPAAGRAFREAIRRRQEAWRFVVQTAVGLGIPVPAMSASLAYYDSYRSERLPANLTQAQRDFFGAHTYRRDRSRRQPSHELEREGLMSTGLTIPDLKEPAGLDFLSLGALIHRLDPGLVPFRKAATCAIHVSGGEFNAAANLSDCFGLRSGIATAMVDYPIGELIAERVRAMGVKPFYKRFQHDGARGPNMATVYSDRGYGVRGPVVFYNRANEAAALLKPGDFDWAAIFGAGVRWFHSGGIFAALSRDDVGADHRGDAGGQGARRRSCPST